MKAKWMSAAFGCLVFGLSAGCAGGHVDGEDVAEAAAAVSTTYSGRASVLRAHVLVVNTNVADTGPLPSSGGTSEVSLLTLNSALLKADALDAFVLGANDHVVAQATAANVQLAISVGSIGVKAGLLASNATAACVNGAPALGGGSLIVGLTINGQSIVVTGAPNQTINLLLGKVVINERTSTVNGASGSIHVAPIHVVVNGLVDVLVSPSDAGVTCAPLPPPPPPTCADGIENGAETGIDCGGPTCAPCANGVGCSVNGDCSSGVCQGGVCVPPPPTCSDGIQNGGETGVDCGGPTCDPCADDVGCDVNSDCESGICQAGVCVPPPPPPTCSDGIENGGETGVDCGGPTCSPCANGGGCVKNNDCQSGNCDAGLCEPPPACIPPDYVMGQGYITSTPSGRHGDFSLYGEIVNGAPTGHVKYDDDGSSEHVQSIDVQSYVVTGPHSRQIIGQCIIRNKIGTFGYTVDVTDNGNGGDVFTIHVTDGYSATGTVASGDIQLVDTCP